MRYENTITYSLRARRALFTDPLTKMGGEKFSYPIPTYQALKGITESLYWKPTFIWYIDRVRVLGKISMEPQNVRPIEYAGGNTLSVYTYLMDVHYHVQAHFEWNDRRPELSQDRNEHKHYYIAKRMIEKGGRRDIFLGTRECQGYAEPCAFDDEEGAYDALDEMTFGFMVHGIDYPDETGAEKLGVRLWQPVMRKGVIDFPRPEACTVRRELRADHALSFALGKTARPVDALFEEEGGAP